MLRILAPAPSPALISLAEVKERLGLTTDDSDDALRLVIADASAAIVAELGFDLAYQRYLETVPAHSGSAAILSRWPIEEASIETATPAGSALSGWSLDGASILRRSAGGACSVGRLAVTYSAGYLLPDQVATWSASTPAALGDWIRPTASSSLRYLVTAAGTLGATEPVWPGVAETVASGSVTLKAHFVPELPEALRALAYREVFARWSARDRDPSQRLSAIEGEGVAERYFAPASAAALDSGVLAGLEPWRYPR